MQLSYLEPGNAPFYPPLAGIDHQSFVFPPATPAK